MTNTIATPAGKELTRDELIAKIAQMEKDIAEQKAASMAALKLKVSEKGGVSVYGLGRFPVTLYGSQWNRLLDSADTIRKFLVDNKEKLAVKGESTEKK